LVPNVYLRLWKSACRPCPVLVDDARLGGQDIYASTKCSG